MIRSFSFLFLPSVVIVCLLLIGWELLLEPAFFDANVTSEKQWECILATVLFAALAMIVPIASVAALEERRRQSDTALRVSEERYRKLVEHTQDWVWETDQNGVYTFVGPQCKTMLGYEPSKLLGRTPFELMPDSEAQRVGAEFKRLVAAKQAIVSLENVNVHKDGHEVILETSALPFFDGSGRLLGYRGIDRDITEYRRSRDQLEEKERFLMSIFDAIQDGISVLDRDLNVVRVNRWMEERYKDKAPFTGKKCYQVFHQRTEPCEYCPSIRTLATGEPHREIVPYPDDQAPSRWIELSAFQHRDPQGEISGIIEYVKDITEQRRTAERLRRRARGLERLDFWVRQLDALTEQPDGFNLRVCEGILDLTHADLSGLTLFDAASGNFTYRAAAGDKAARLMDRTLPVADSELQAAIAKPDQAISIPGRGENPSLSSELARELEVDTALFSPLVVRTYVTGGLHVFHCGKTFDEIDAELLTLYSHRVAAAMANMDLLGSLEQRVRERTAELEIANEELTSFSYSVSHDLRAPLRAIDGFSQALLEDYEDRLDAIGKDYLYRVRRASQRMGILIDDMLMLSRVTRREMGREAVDLAVLAREVVYDLKERSRGRNLDFRAPDSLRVQGDPQLLRILLENLLDNAWKYTSRNPVARIELGIQANADERCFYVRDNGVGFDNQYADNLFKPFQRLHRGEEFQGSGIGLATVARIVHRHRGRVWADGRVDRGASIYFTVPG